MENPWLSRDGGWGEQMKDDCDPKVVSFVLKIRGSNDTEAAKQSAKKYNENEIEPKQRTFKVKCKETIPCHIS